MDMEIVDMKKHINERIDKERERTIKKSLDIIFGD